MREIQIFKGLELKEAGLAGLDYRRRDGNTGGEHRGRGNYFVESLFDPGSDAGTSESVLTCVIHVHVGAQLLFDTNDVLGPGI